MTDRERRRSSGGSGGGRRHSHEHHYHHHHHHQHHEHGRDEDVDVDEDDDGKGHERRRERRRSSGGSSGPRRSSKEEKRRSSGGSGGSRSADREPRRRTPPPSPIEEDDEEEEEVGERKMKKEKKRSSGASGSRRTSKDKEERRQSAEKEEPHTSHRHRRSGSKGEEGGEERRTSNPPPVPLPPPPERKRSSAGKDAVNVHIHFGPTTTQEEGKQGVVSPGANVTSSTTTPTDKTPHETDNTKTPDTAVTTTASSNHHHHHRKSPPEVELPGSMKMKPYVTQAEEVPEKDELVQTLSTVPNPDASRVGGLVVMGHGGHERHYPNTSLAQVPTENVQQQTKPPPPPKDPVVVKKEKEVVAKEPPPSKAAGVVKPPPPANPPPKSKPSNTLTLDEEASNVTQNVEEWNTATPDHPTHFIHLDSSEYVVAMESQQTDSVVSSSRAKVRPPASESDVKKRYTDEGGLRHNNICPFCRKGRFRRRVTTAGYLAAFLLFPIGTYFCLTKKCCVQDVCSYCGRYKPKK